MTWVYPQHASFLWWLGIPPYIEEQDGWNPANGNFRARETEALDEFAETNMRASHVLSLWGWTLEYPQYNRNIKILQKAGYLIVYINTSIDTILEWKAAGASWAEHRMEIDEKGLKELHKKRDPYYRKPSWLIVTNEESIDDTAIEITQWALKKQ
jgi:shikimate kinase